MDINAKYQGTTNQVSIICARRFLVCCLGSLIAQAPLPVLAQINPDQTLSSPSVVITNGTTREITGGVTQNSNLFHSFEQFSVPEQSTAWFNNDPTVQNILARVTGSSLSRIDGLIRANGSANLFLLNPNGIIIGANAQLDIGGSFIGSTADSIQFSDGSEFNAVNPSPTALLTISAPIGLQYGSNPRQIVVEGPGHQLRLDPDSLTIIRNDRPTGLQVQPGRTLALVGGDVFLRGGNLTAPSGQIALGAVGSNSIVSLTPLGLGWQLGYSDVAQFRDIQLTQAASGDTSSTGGGAIQAWGRQILLTEGSSLIANTQGDIRGDGVQIRASESVQVVGVSADPLTGEVLFPSSIFSDVEPGAIAAGGNLSIATQRLVIAEGGQVTATTFGSGDAGDLSVMAQTTELWGGAPVVGSSGLASLVELNARGSAGNIALSTNQLLIGGGAAISSSTFGLGDAGDVRINAESIDLQGTSPGGFPSGVFSQSEEGATGRGGNLLINAGNVRIGAGAQISSSTLGAGDAGSVQLQARSLVLVGNAEIVDLPSAILSTVNATSTGRGGNVTIQADDVGVFEGAQIAVSTAGLGDAGNLIVQANRVELAGSSAFGRSGLFASAIIGTGAGGDIRLNANELAIRDGAVISVSNFSSRNPNIPPGQGPAGSIFIAARNLQMSNRGAITASNAVRGRGDVTIQSELLSMERESSIATNAQGREPGGNITINTRFLAASGNSDITANAVNARGGRVRITAEGIFGIEFREQLTPESDITVTSALGPEFNGVVELNTPDADPSRGLVELPQNLINRNDQIIAACEQFRGNELIVTGRGGLPEVPDQPLQSQSVWHDLRLAGQSSGTGSLSFTSDSYPVHGGVTPETMSIAPVVEAQGWLFDEDGHVTLVADPLIRVTQSSSAINCPALGNHGLDRT